jgi:hypothetical protein
MKQYSEAFIGFDTAKKKHAVAIALSVARVRSGIWARSTARLRRSSG